MDLSSFSDLLESNESEESEALEDNISGKRWTSTTEVGMAKTHEIAENCRWRQELESDSELSELASSVFNGMEDIEIGRGVEDQEMSGTLADGENHPGNRWDRDWWR
jgi:hypothetical protein